MSMALDCAAPCPCSLHWMDEAWEFNRITAAMALYLRVFLSKSLSEPTEYCDCTVSYGYGIYCISDLPEE